MKSSVLDRFTEAGVSFEVYSDGACVISNASPGYMEISAETIRRISAKLPTVKAKSETQPVTTFSTDPQEAKVSGDVSVQAPAQTHTASAQKTQRGVFKNADGVWVCEFKQDGLVVGTQTYSSRDWARKGALTTQVGTEGRLS